MQSTSSTIYLKPLAIRNSDTTNYEVLNIYTLDQFSEQIEKLSQTTVDILGFVIPLEFNFQSDQLAHFDGISLLECLLQVPSVKEKPVLIYSWLTLESVLRIRPSSALISANTFYKQMPFDLTGHIALFSSLNPNPHQQTAIGVSDLASTYHDMANDYYGAYRLWVGFKHAITTHAQAFTEPANTLQKELTWWVDKEHYFNSLLYKSQQAKLQNLPITRPHYPDYFDFPELLNHHIKSGIDKKWRILYIDDEYQKGYSDVLRSIFFFKEVSDNQLIPACLDLASETGDAWEQTTDEHGKSTRFVACSNIKAAEHWLKNWGILRLNSEDQNQSLCDFLTRLEFFLNQSAKGQDSLISLIDPENKSQSKTIKLYKDIKQQNIQNNTSASIINKLLDQLKEELEIQVVLQFLSNLSNSKTETFTNFESKAPKIPDNIDKPRNACLINNFAKLLKAAIEEEVSFHRPNTTKISNNDEFLEAEKKRCNPPFTTVIFLDLKLEPHCDVDKDITHYTSIQLLEKISKQSPSTSVVLFTASRQVLNYLQIFDSSRYRIKGWFVKEAPDMSESPENSMHAMYYLLRKCHSSSFLNESDKITAKKCTHYDLFLIKNQELIDSEEKSLYELIQIYSDTILFNKNNGLIVSKDKKNTDLADYIKIFMQKESLKSLNLKTLEEYKIEKQVKTIFLNFLNRIICYTLLLLFEFNSNSKEKWDLTGLNKFFLKKSSNNTNTLSDFVDSTNDLLGAYGSPSTFNEIVLMHEQDYFQKLFHNNQFLHVWAEYQSINIDDAPTQAKKVLMRLFP